MLTALDGSIWEAMFSFQIPPTEKIIRTILVYLAIDVIIRMFGKRLMAQMTSMDLVVVLLLSNVVQNAIIGDDNSLIGGVLGAFTLVFFNWVLDRIIEHSAAIRWVLQGRRSDVVVDGEVDERQMRKMGLRRQELEDALRIAGADHIDEVKKGSLEPGGQVVVELFDGEEAASKADLERQLTELRDYLDAKLDGLRGASRA